MLLWFLHRTILLPELLSERYRQVMNLPIAVFGYKVFQVTPQKTNTFSDFQYGSTLETEKQDAAGKKPSTYNKGPGLDTLVFKVRLSVDLGVNPRIELGQWLAIKDAGIAYPFILGGVPFRPNKWLLIDVQATEEVIDNNGNMLALTLSLKFDEYVRPGSSQSNANKTNTNNSNGKSDISAIMPVADYKPNTLSPAEKAQLK